MNMETELHAVETVSECKALIAQIDALLDDDSISDADYDALDATGALIGSEGTPEVKDFRKQKPWQNIWGAKISEFIFGRITENLTNQSRTFEMQTPHAEG